MKDTDIEMLEDFFVQAGQRSWESEQILLAKAAEVLLSASNTPSPISRMETSNVDAEGLSFQISMTDEKGESYKADYQLQVAAGGEQLFLKQQICGQHLDHRTNLKLWYIRKRNALLQGRCQYQEKMPVSLQTTLTIRPGWESELIRKISDMNWILSQDYAIFKSLDYGIVPEKLQDEIREEYHAYEREINHDITV